MREYLYAEQLADLTPWSVEAIETMVRRGFFRCGIEYFQPQGRRGRRIFKWSAVVVRIQESVESPPATVIEKEPPRHAPAVNGQGSSEIEEATAALQRLLD